jgi:hypothetical protein
MVKYIREDKLTSSGCSGWDMIPELRALPSSGMLSSSPGDGDLSLRNGSLDIRHHCGPSGAGTWALSSAICLCRRRRRPRVQARLRAEERTRSWPYTAAEWTRLHRIATQIDTLELTWNGEILTCGTAVGLEREKSRQYLVWPTFVQNGPSEELPIQLFKWCLLQATKVPVSLCQGTRWPQTKSPAYNCTSLQRKISSAL